MEVGRRGVYTYHYTVTNRMTSELRWAAMRAILIFHNCEGQSHNALSTDHNIWRERRAEADSSRSPSAYQPNALPLLNWVTGSPGGHSDFHTAPELWVTSQTFPALFQKGQTNRAVPRGTKIYQQYDFKPRTITTVEFIQILFCATLLYFCHCKRNIYCSLQR